VPTFSHFLQTMVYLMKMVGEEEVRMVDGGGGIREEGSAIFPIIGQAHDQPLEPSLNASRCDIESLLQGGLCYEDLRDNIKRV
jgi:hypothetical protein